MTTQELERAALDHGLATPNQVERWTAGVLPDDELCKLARVVLFAPFEHMRRWQKMRASTLQHDDTCLGSARDVRFETTDASDLTHEQWEIGKALRDLAKQASRHSWCVAAKVEFSCTLQSHWMSCSRCLAEVMRPSMLITVSWAGRMLSREYAL